MIYLQPTIPEIIVEDYKDQIKTLLENQRIGPELRVQDFDEYMPLINGEVNDYTFTVFMVLTLCSRMKKELMNSLRQNIRLTTTSRKFCVTSIS